MRGLPPTDSLSALTCRGSHLTTPLPLLGDEDGHAAGAHQIALLGQERELQALFGDVKWRSQGGVGEAEPLVLADLRQFELEAAGVRVGDEMHIVARTVVVQLRQLHRDRARCLSPVRLRTLHTMPRDVETAFAMKRKAVAAQ